MPKPSRQAAVAEALSKALADSYALYLKTHGYHWNVRGPHFSSLHNLFMTQYTEQWAALDEIAERIRTLGEFAPQGYGAFGNLTSIKDGDPAKTWDEMLRELIADHGVVVDTLKAAFEPAEAAGDEATADLLTQRIAAHEKHAWMLRATLGEK